MDEIREAIQKREAGESVPDRGGLLSSLYGQQIKINPRVPPDTVWMLDQHGNTVVVIRT